MKSQLRFVDSVMRLGKKSKEVESKSQTIEGINRLICTSKSQNHPLTGKASATATMELISVFLLRQGLIVTVHWIGAT